MKRNTRHRHGVKRAIGRRTYLTLLILYLCAGLIAPVMAQSRDVTFYVVDRPPLTDPRRPDGGVIVALFVKAMERARFRPHVQWLANEGELLQRLHGMHRSAAIIFGEGEGCGQKTKAPLDEPPLCKASAASDPMLFVSIGVFSRSEAKAEGNDPSHAPGKTQKVCLAEAERGLAGVLAGSGIQAGKSITVVYGKSIIDCMALTESGDVDGFAALEPEGRYVIAKLKLGRSYRMTYASSRIIALRALVVKASPGKDRLLGEINAAIAKFRANGDFVATVLSHRGDLLSPVQSKLAH